MAEENNIERTTPVPSFTKEGKAAATRHHQEKVGIVTSTKMQKTIGASSILYTKGLSRGARSSWRTTSIERPRKATWCGLWRAGHSAKTNDGCSKK